MIFLHDVIEIPLSFDIPYGCSTIAWSQRAIDFVIVLIANFIVVDQIGVLGKFNKSVSSVFATLGNESIM